MRPAAPTSGGVSVESLARQFAALRAEVKGLRADVAEVPALRARIAVLEALRARDFDPADLDLLVCIAQTTRGRRFTCGQLLRHAAAHPALQQALLGADVENALLLGKRLEKLAHFRGEVRIVHEGKSRGVARWRVIVVVNG